MPRMLRFVWDLFVSHKARFLLTISGVVVGVASLVTLASLLQVGEGVLRASSMQASGEDVISVSNDFRARQKHPNERRLGREDFDALRRTTLLDSTGWTAIFGMGEVPASVGTETARVRAVGVGPPVFEVHGLTVAQGRPLGEADFEGLAKVVVVGSLVKEKLTSLEVGGPIKIDSDMFTVVGIMEKKPAMGPGEEFGWNNRVLVPERVFGLYFQADRRPQSIVGKVNPPVGYEGILKDYVKGVRSITQYILMLDRTYKNFDLGDAQQSGSTEQIILLVIKILVVLTTIFSMLVGGINIMNIMLVTVTERTREIGIRRALGATRSDILRQFIAETLGITLTGAVIGTILAVATLALASALLTRWVYPWPFFVATWSLGLGLGFSILIGLVFGISPALRAANLDPVEALRYE